MIPSSESPDSRAEPAPVTLAREAGGPWLWRVTDSGIRAVRPMKPTFERQIEGWLEAKPEILLKQLLIIGRQVDARGRIVDLLAMDSEGSLHVIEVKREGASRLAIAQLVEYAGWAAMLTFDDITRIFMAYSGRHLAVAFRERFDRNLPTRLNRRQILTVCARSVAPGVADAVEYLGRHGLVFRFVLLTQHLLHERVYLSTTEWVVGSSKGPSDEPVDGAASSEAINAATSTLLTELHLRTEGLHSAIGELRRPVPAQCQELDKPSWVHPDTYCFVVLYLPRFIWSFVPSSLLWLLYQRWIREEAAYGVQRHQRWDAQKELAEAVSALGGWEKRQVSIKTAAPLMAADEPLAKLVEWAKPLEKINAVGYRRL